MAGRRTKEAFTRLELSVVIIVFAVVAALIVPALQRASWKSGSICCNCNLKQIGTAYRIWENDNGGRHPATAPETNGGWSNLVFRTNASVYTWTNYSIMGNNLGQSPLVLVCPADEREPAKTFSNFISNTNLSYFVGVDSIDTVPQSILGGDRNIGPGTTPDPQYGFSPANGAGSNVFINGPVCWSVKMHSRGNPAGLGNILLGDGSAQQITSASLYSSWVKTAQAASTNSAGLHWIFP